MEYVPVTVHTGEPGTRNEELLSKRFIQHGDRWRKVHTLNDVKTRQRHGENWGLLKGDITRNTWNIIKTKLGQENQIWAGKHKAEGDKLWHYGRPWRVAPPKKNYWGNFIPGGRSGGADVGGRSGGIVAREWTQKAYFSQILFTNLSKPVSVSTFPLPR